MSKRAPVLVGLGIATLLVIIWYFYEPDRDRGLDRSLLGNDGLLAWLPQNDVPVTKSTRRRDATYEDFSIAILPLHTVSFGSPSPSPSSREERRADSDPRPLRRFQLRSKLGRAPTLVVLPKWRMGVALDGIARPGLLIGEPVEDILDELGLGEVDLVLPHANTMLEESVDVPGSRQPFRVALFQPQLIRHGTLPAHCEELIGLAAGALMISCAPTGRSEGFWLLTDPDLLNNHGLALAENALAAASVAHYLRRDDTRPLYLDVSTEIMARNAAERQGGPPREREPDDLARLLRWPLSGLLGVAGVILLLAVWRGWRRFGPIDPTDGAEGVEQSRTASIAAKARLLRLTGADATMAAEFVRARLAALAVGALGSGHGNAAGIARWFQLLARRDRELSDALRAESDTLMAFPPERPDPDLYRRLEAFRDLMEKANDGT